MFANKYKCIKNSLKQAMTSTSTFMDTMSTPIDIDDKQLFPHLHLLVSGGNSQLIILHSWQDWRIVGATLDDAAGESFDKIGRMLGLPYPAGVYLAKIAKDNAQNYLNLPVGMQKDKTLNYSFSGLKTSVRYLVQNESKHIANLIFEQSLTQAEIEQLLATTKQDYEQGTLLQDNPKLVFIYQLCCSAQEVITAQLVKKLEQAIIEFQPLSIGLSGGVSANLMLRNKMEQLCAKYKINHFLKPALALTGDNAVMIGLAGIANLLN